MVDDKLINKEEENLDPVTDTNEELVSDIDTKTSDSVESKIEESELSKDSNVAGNISEYASFLIGRKVGMTRLFNESGKNIPVTIINIDSNVITQIKSNKTDGYSAIQVGMGKANKKKKTKAFLGKFSSRNIDYKELLKEFKVSDNVIDTFSEGMKLNVDIFNVGDYVKISGKSHGKGFTGHMKRHGFGGGRRSHGKNSVMRKAGAIGASADPARVWPGKKMAGRSGNEQRTVKNLRIEKIDIESNNIFVNGSIPGANNGIVYLES